MEHNCLQLLVLMLLLWYCQGHWLHSTKTATATERHVAACVSVDMHSMVFGHCSNASCLCCSLVRRSIIEQTEAWGAANAPRRRWMATATKTHAPLPPPRHRQTRSRLPEIKREARPLPGVPSLIKREIVSSPLPASLFSIYGWNTIIRPSPLRPWVACTGGESECQNNTSARAGVRALTAQNDPTSVTGRTPRGTANLPASTGTFLAICVDRQRGSSKSETYGKWICGHSMNQTAWGTGNWSGRACLTKEKKKSTFQQQQNKALVEKRMLS